jgi:hypothetical protein
MISFKKVALAATVSLMAVSAQAATLTSSVVTVDPNVTPASSDARLNPQSVTVIIGEEGNVFGNQFFDVNAGAGDEFTIRSTFSYGGFLSLDTVSWTVSGLTFSDGEVLTGISFLTSIGSATVTSLTDSSFTFAYEDVAIPQGVYIRAQYLTAPSPVPLPAALPLLVFGLFGLGAVARRRRDKAA